MLSYRLAAKQHRSTYFSTRMGGGAPQTLETLGSQAQRFPVLFRALPTQGFLDPNIPVVSHITIEHRRELADAHTIPIPTVEELVFEPSEEALHG